MSVIIGTLAGIGTVFAGAALLNNAPATVPASLGGFFLGVLVCTLVEACT